MFPMARASHAESTFGSKVVPGPARATLEDGVQHVFALGTWLVYRMKTLIRGCGMAARL